MRRTVLLPAAYLLDAVAGDPEWFPHPVRLMGLAISRGERALRKPDQSPARAFTAGATLSIGLVAAAYTSTWFALRLANRQSKALGSALEVALAWTCLASHNLQQEALSVFAALDADNLPLARTRIARIVGRDTAELDATEISRALIETLAESAGDGIVAPLLALAAGGVPLAMAYKAINTLDSMIGHRDERYLYFGKAAARMDDGANYLPSRLTAASIVACAQFSGLDTRAAWRVWRKDARKHKSPNAGHPEAAMAGALGVRLGGDNHYAGELVPAPSIGAHFPAPTLSQAQQAIRITLRVSLLGLGTAIVLAALLQHRRNEHGCTSCR